MNARSMAPFAGLAALALFVTPLGALAGTEDSSHIVGSVLADERNRVLPGVTIVALLEGVTPSGSAVTDADGRFHLEVPRGNTTCAPSMTAPPSWRASCVNFASRRARPSPLTFAWSR